MYIKFLTSEYRCPLALSQECARKRMGLKISTAWSPSPPPSNQPTIPLLARGSPSICISFCQPFLGSIVLELLCIGNRKRCITDSSHSCKYQLLSPMAFHIAGINNSRWGDKENSRSAVLQHRTKGGKRKKKRWTSSTVLPTGWSTDPLHKNLSIAWAPDGFIKAYT